jgi:hypothetical protein
MNKPDDNVVRVLCKCGRVHDAKTAVPQEGTS